MRRRRFLTLSTVSGLAVTRALSAGAFHAPARADEAQPRLGDLLIHRRASDQFDVRHTPDRDRPLRVLQLTDTHFHPSDSTDRTATLIRGLVDREKPDLVIHTGDFVNNDARGPVEWKALEIMNGLGVPWTLCFGNHDYPVNHGAGSLTLDSIQKRIAHGLQGHLDAATGRHYCYRYDLLAGAGVKPAASLFFFQVGYAEGDRKISLPQLEWFERQVAADEDREVDAPITVFVHIPLLEHHKLFERGPVAGVKAENVCFDSDTGESFKRFAGSNRVVGVFCGHDHVNNFHGDWEGTDLVYGRVSGWGGYGPPDWQRGGRLIEIDLNAPRATLRHAEVF